MSGAFVAGATGLTGREVVRQLASRGARPIAHVRPDSARVEEWRARFVESGALVDTTAWQEAALSERLRALAPQVVFALLGTTRARGKRAERERGERDTYESVDYGLTALLLRAALRAASRPRFVYLSALGVSDHARGAYYQARAKVEQELRASGLPFTIVRPSFIIGERDEFRPGERIGSTLADAALSLAGTLGAKRLRQRYHSISGRELAARLVELAYDPAAENRIVEADELR
jgi:uncharacterized protein YbjT (DUF2867 family)